MLARLFGGTVGDEQSWADHQWPSAETAAVVTRTAVAGKRWICTSIKWSYSDTPTTGRLTVTDGVTTLCDLDIIAGGPGSLPLGKLGEGSVGADLTITLAAGGTGITGKLNCEGILK